MVYLVPTPPAEAAHEATDEVCPKVEVSHFNEKGTHAFHRNVSKLRLSCKRTQS